MSTTSETLAGVKSSVTPSEVLQKLLNKVYTLYYRKGNNPHSMTKNFYSNGKDLMETVAIAKQHCEAIGGRFVRLEPFISDLRKDELRFSGHNENGAEE